MGPFLIHHLTNLDFSPTPPSFLLTITMPPYCHSFSLSSSSGDNWLRSASLLLSSISTLPLFLTISLIWLPPPSPYHLRHALTLMMTSEHQLSFFSSFSGLLCLLLWYSRTYYAAPALCNLCFKVWCFVWAEFFHLSCLFNSKWLCITVYLNLILELKYHKF